MEIGRDTISSRLGKGKKANKPVHTVLASIVDFIFLIVFKDADHCVRNIEYIDDRYSLSTYLKIKKGLMPHLVFIFPYAIPHTIDSTVLCLDLRRA